MPFHRKFIGQPERLSRGPGPSERFAGALGATPGRRVATIAGGAATLIPGAGLAAKGVASGAKAVQAALAAKRFRDAQRAVAEATRNLNRLQRVKASAVKINTAKQQVNAAKDALRNVGGPPRVAPRRVVPTMMQQRATMGMKKGPAKKKAAKRVRIQQPVGVKDPLAFTAADKAAAATAATFGGAAAVGGGMGYLRRKLKQPTRVEFKKGGAVKSSRKKSIDGPIVRKGHTRAPHR